MRGVPNASGPSLTLGLLGPSHQWCDKSRASLRSPPCAHGVVGTPQGEVRDNLQQGIYTILGSMPVSHSIGIGSLDPIAENNVNGENGKRLDSRGHGGTGGVLRSGRGGGRGQEKPRGWLGRGRGGRQARVSSVAIVATTATTSGMLSATESHVPKEGPFCRQSIAQVTGSIPHVSIISLKKKVREQSVPSVGPAQRSDRNAGATRRDFDSLEEEFSPATWTKSKSNYSTPPLPFTGAIPRCTHPYNSVPSCSDIFQRFFTPATMKKIVWETNRYASIVVNPGIGGTKGSIEWKPLQYDEFKAFYQSPCTWA